MTAGTAFSDTKWLWVIGGSVGAYVANKELHGAWKVIGILMAFGLIANGLPQLSPSGQGWLAPRGGL